MWRRCLKLPNLVRTRILVAIVQYCISAKDSLFHGRYYSFFIVMPFPTKIVPLHSEIQS